MKILKILLETIAITIVSCFLLTAANGMPNKDRVVQLVAEIFFVTLVGVVFINKRIT